MKNNNDDHHSRINPGPLSSTHLMECFRFYLCVCARACVCECVSACAHACVSLSPPCGAGAGGVV